MADLARAELVEAMARAIYDEWEGPVADQDFGRQSRQWEMCKLLAPVALTSLERKLQERRLAPPFPWKE